MPAVDSRVVRPPVAQPRRLGVLALAVFFGGTGAAGAARDSELAKAATAAKRAFVEGRYEALVQQGERALRAASSDGDDARIGELQLLLGLGHAMLGRTAAARGRFAKALRSDPGLTLDAHRYKPELRALFEGVRAALQGRVKITAEGPGASATIDGNPVGTPPLWRAVTVGRHEVVVRQGARRFSRFVTVPVDGEVTVHAEWALRPGRARVSSSPASARVAVDGRIAGETPVTLELAPGPHRLRLERRGYAPALRTITVVAGRATEVAVSLVARASPAQPGGRRLWTWVAAGTAAAAAAAALGVYLSAAADYDEYQETGDPQRFRELASRISDKTRAVNALIGTSAAIAAGAVALFFLEPRWGHADGREPRRTAARCWRFDGGPAGADAGFGLTTRF